MKLRIFFVILILLVMIAGYWLGNQYQKDRLARLVKPLSAVVLEPPKKIKDFHLLRQADKDFRLNDLKNGWTLVYFGYTFCPDICPTSMSNLASVINRLAVTPQIQNKVNVIMVSVDPKRDNPDHLNQYVKYFNQKFIGITGKPDDLKQLADDFGVYFYVHEDKGDNNYPVDHGSSVGLVNPQGLIAAIFPTTINPQLMADDLRLIIEAYD